VLGGAVAAPCNPQSAIAGLNSCMRIVILTIIGKSSVDYEAHRNRKPRTLSGPEGSSNKRSLRCVDGQLDMS